jgi:glycolate oxidase
MYNPVTPAVVESLCHIAGRAGVLFDPAAIDRYSHDETVGLYHSPEVIVRAASTAQVSEVLRLAQRERIPVTPRGAGYGLSGGAVPLHGGIVLTTEKMSHILEIDRQNLMVVTQPGVITGDLHRAVEAEGLFYPPDPASLDSCTIGGNVASGAGGPRAVKYGTTRDYVCGLEMVLPSGDTIRTGGKLVKNTTGYSLAQLITGSEGTLAVVTEITLRLVPLPPIQVDLLVPFDDFQAAADTVSDLISHRVLPTCIEFMERDSILAAERLLQKTVPYGDAAAHLLFQLDGTLSEAVDAEMETVADVCLRHGARDALVAKDRPTRDRLWEARRKILDAINNESPVNHKEDVVVPRATIHLLLKGLRELARHHGVRIISFGHAGDGNVHVSVLKDGLSEDLWQQLVPAVTEEIFHLALSLGGTLTGEHGIGITRRRYLPLALDAAQIDLMRGIRDLFDPHRILNPGKIFP